MSETESLPRPFDFSLLEQLRRASARVLMLDYDGTLAPFRTQRMEAEPYPGIPEALEHLIAAGHTHLVIVSGRPVAEILALLPLAARVDIWGAHGWERKHPDGRRELWQPSQPVAARLEQSVAAVIDCVPVDALEIKRGAVAVHTRAMNHADRNRVNAVIHRHWESIADNEKLQLREFDGGFELRDITRTKATVVESLRSAYDHNAQFAYLGDDRTDEDAFAALQPPDWSILVKVSPQPSRARFWLKPPRGLIDFIRNWTALGALHKLE